MYSDTNTTRSVADAVMKVMNEKLHPNQQKLDVHEPEKDELTADDFKKLRAGKKEVKKEEVETVEEAAGKLGSKAPQAKVSQHSTLKPVSNPKTGLSGQVPASKEVKKEEVENIGEASTYKLGRAAAETKDFPIHHNGEHVGRLEFHTSAGKLHHRVSSIAGVPHEKFIGHPDREKMTNTHVVKHEAEARKHFAKKIKEEVEQEETILEYESKDGKFVHNAKTGRYGGSEKPTDPFAGVRGPGQKDLEKIEAEKKKKQKKFSEMVNLYQEKGLKSLSEMLVKEEPTNDEYKAELEDVKAKASGAKKNPDIAKGKVDAVKQEEVEVIEEKKMTEPEMKKREEIVMSMKKGMAGFKERYGDRAKNVMYATATKQAKKSA